MQRDAKAVHDALPYFLGFVNRVFHQSVASPRYRLFFSVAETRSWHQDIVITRGVHFSASPDRRVDPSTAIGRGPCVLQIQLSWKQTGTTWPPPNKLTPSIVHVRLTDYGVLFPNSRLIYFIYSLQLLILRVALNILFTFTLKRV